MISEYFDQVKKQIEEFEHITDDYSLEEKTYSDERGYISGEVSFIDLSRLDFAEVKDMEIKEKLKYQYHYMDSNNELIFRYDNAKHHKNIETFPHHNHLPNRITARAESVKSYCLFCQLYSTLNLPTLYILKKTLPYSFKVRQRFLSSIIDATPLLNIA